MGNSNSLAVCTRPLCNAPTAALHWTLPRAARTSCQMGCASRVLQYACGTTQKLNTSLDSYHAKAPGCGEVPGLNSANYTGQHQRWSSASSSFVLPLPLADRSRMDWQQLPQGLETIFIKNTGCHKLLQASTHTNTYITISRPFCCTIDQQNCKAVFGCHDAIAAST